MANAMNLVPFVKEFEGGFVNNIHDSGGATNKGVTLATYRKVFGAEKTVDDLKKITDTDWMHIFKKSYWDKCKADNIENQAVANMLVDWYWHSGSIAVKKLQRILGVQDDGIIGNITLGKLNAANQEELFDALKKARIDFFNAIVERKPSQSIFIKGWLRRVNAINFSKMEY